MTVAPVTSAAELQRLAALAAYDVLDPKPDDPYVADLTNVCELAATVLGVATAAVNLIDDRLQHQVAAFGVDPTPCRRDESMCETTLAEGTDVVLSDASADPRYASSPWVDGRLGNIRLYCSAVLRTPDGHAIGTLCVFDDAPRVVSEAQRRALGLLARQVVDVLELRLRSHQLERSHAELSRAQDRLAAFAGQISHDLKAPITAIVGFSELLGDLDGVGDDPSAMSYVARCNSAAKRMLAMIDDLLAYARVGGTLTPTLNSLDTVLPDVIAELGAAAVDADITWSGPDVLADPGQLHALLRNLLSNAVTYRGSRPCVVRVMTEPVGDAMVLRVIDNGPGIPPQRRDDVLRPLVRVRKDVVGAGLGLAVCVRVVAAHGGTIRLEETPDGGTTAVVVLPL